MRLKRTLIVAFLVALLAVGAGGVGAQLIPGSKIIERLRADTKGGWIKIDKRPGKPGHERVYCITLDGQPACDWGDVRKVHVYTISE